MGTKWIGPEKPRSGGDWLGGALMHERARVRLLQEANMAEEHGDPQLAQQFRKFAEGHRQERDRAQRDEERRNVNRRRY
jgi:hypothetical protein